MSRSVRNCAVCVTGGAGFLGSHMVNHLIEDRNCKVLVIDNLCAGRREHIHPDAKFVHADITVSESFLCRLFDKYDTKYVFSYAAWPYIPDSFDRPAHVCGVNFTGAMNVINAAADAECEGILQVSSAEIYGEDHNAPGSTHRGTTSMTGKIGEGFPVTPRSSYGASKAAIDAYVQARWREAGVPCLALRQFNCLGERETHEYVVPEIIRQLHHGTELDEQGRRVVRLGNNSVRDFMYAGDAVRAAAELVECGRWGEVYNLGSESGVHVYDLALLLAEAAGVDGVVVKEDPTRKRPWEIWHLCSDNAKINSVIDYRPRVPLPEALRLTVEDYRANGNRWCWEPANTPAVGTIVQRAA